MVVDFHKECLQEGPKDLMNKQWSMQLPDSGGKFGHFYNTRVRRITSKVCFRCHFEVQKEISLSGRSKCEVTTSEAKFRGGETKLLPITVCVVQGQQITAFGNSASSNSVNQTLWWDIQANEFQSASTYICSFGICESSLDFICFIHLNSFNLSFGSQL